MGKKRLISVLLFLILSFNVCFIIFIPQELMGMEIIGRGKRLPAKKINFLISEPGFHTIIPNLSFCWVRAKVKYLDRSSILVARDNNKDLGFMIFYNPKDNNIYAHDLVGKGDVFEEGEVTYKGNSYHYRLKYNYYYIGKGKLENGVFKPSFVAGTFFSFYKPFFDFAYNEHIKIHIPGDLKPAFTAYLIDLDGERRRVVVDQE